MMRVVKLAIGLVLLLAVSVSSQTGGAFKLGTLLTVEALTDSLDARGASWLDSLEAQGLISDSLVGVVKAAYVRDSIWAVVVDSLLVDRDELSDSLSLKADTSETNALAAADSLLDAATDSLKYYWGIAGDTTSPGMAYAIDMSDGKWYRADSSVYTIADGIAVDSVNKDGTCRFQYAGFLAIPWYNLKPPGVSLVNGFTDGEIVEMDAARDSTLKMQVYGTATSDSTTIKVEIEPSYWRYAP